MLRKPTRHNLNATNQEIEQVASFEYLSEDQHPANSMKPYITNLLAKGRLKTGRLQLPIFRTVYTPTLTYICRVLNPE